MSNQTNISDESTTADAFPTSSLQDVAQQEQLTSGLSTDLDQRPSSRIPSFPEPPSDWGFNIFLRSLEDRITEKELASIKSLFEGEGGIGKGVLEKMKTPTDLFRILRHRGYLDRNNLLYLQSALFWIQRKDLVKEAAEYARTNEDVLHFYCPSDQPENGYRFVKFHIAGKDFTTFRRDELEDLRRRASKIIMAPEKFVLIAGIETSESIVVTFMIPEMYVEILSELLKSSPEMPSLSVSGVDSIDVVGDRKYHIKEINTDIPKASQQEIELANVYKQLRDAKSQLEGTEAEFLETCHQLEECQARLTQTEENLKLAELNIKSLTHLLNLTKDENSPASLQVQAAFSRFKSILDQLSNETVNKSKVVELIDSTVNVMTFRMQEAYRLRHEQMRIQLQDLQTQLIPLLFENARLGFIANGFDFGRLAVPVIEVRVPVQLSPHDQEISQNISKQLRQKDKEILMNKYIWRVGGQGTIEALMNQDPNFFMIGIYHKEVERTRQFIEFEPFMLQCLSEIGRDDLKKLLKPSNSTTTQQNRQKQQQQQQQSAQKQYEKQNQYQRQQQFFPGQRPGEDGAQAFPSRNVEDVIRNMARQMQEMYNLITAKQSLFDPKLHEWNPTSFSF